MPTSTSDRVLWVTEEPPDRSLGGGSIRQAHLFETLAAEIPTDLLVVGDTADDRVRATAADIRVLPPRRAPWTQHPVGRRALELGIILGSPYPSAMYPAFPGRRALGRELKQRGRDYGAVIVEHEALVPLCSELAGVPRVVTLHHLVSQMIEHELAQPAGARQRWYRRRDLAKARHLEAEALRRFDRVITCSAEDAAALRSLDAATRADIRVIPNGVDLSAFAVTPLPEQPRVLFPGSLAYAPNVDGAVWFVREIWPRIRERSPRAELRLAGREPVAEVRALAEVSGVSVHPNVPSMVDQFQWARTVVVPLRIGTGTRLKALEAMASARPAVGTSIGLGGIDISDGVHACVRDGPEGFADAVVATLEDDGLSTGLARAGRAHVEARFGWERIGAQLVAVVGELLATRPDQPPATAAR